MCRTRRFDCDFLGICNMSKMRRMSSSSNGPGIEFSLRALERLSRDVGEPVSIFRLNFLPIAASLFFAADVLERELYVAIQQFLERHHSHSALFFGRYRPGRVLRRLQAISVTHRMRTPRR
jgi:hypothetical protein